jgi:adenine-specific DNA-methyltransferase
VRKKPGTTHDFDKIPSANKEINSMSEDVQETPSSTPNFKTELAKQLQELVPEAIADGKVDVAKLKELLGDDADDGSERFGLFWPGKLRAIRAAQEPTTATLAPEPEKSKDWDTTKNVFIEGDNLESLKILQKHYHGKIKMIYIDPPYNTGKDFIYPDNYQEGLKTYLEWTKQVNEEGQKIKSNPETDGRYHSHWLNMMYPRLKLARSLLSDDGVIFISIDNSEVSHLRNMADDIFGEQNFITQFIWNSSTGGGIRAKFVNINHQYVICYVKDKNSAPSFWAPLSPDAVKQYKLSDNNGLYRDKDFAWKNSSGNKNQIYPITTPDGQVILPKSGYIVRFVRSRFLEELKAGNVTFKQTETGPFVDKYGNQAHWNIYIKKYLSDGMGAPTSVIPKGLVGINNEGTTELQQLLGERYFENPKNVRLIDYLLKVGGTRADDIVLDFFSGSATTAHAVIRLNAEDGGNRRHIQVQLPEPVDPDSPAGKAGFKTIADIARKRIDLAGEKIKHDYAEQLVKRDTPLDVGYRTYKLTDTNFAKWRESSSTDQGTLEQHLLDLRDNANDDATELALLTEVLLKQGYSLTEQVRRRTIDGLAVWSIGDDNLALAYMDERVKPTLNQLRALVDREPEKLIVLEDAFQGDDELKTNLVQASKTKHVGLWTA